MSSVCEQEPAPIMERETVTYDGSGLALITGGTGTLGRLVVRRLRAHDRHVRVLSRSAHLAEGQIEFVRGDLLTGEGLDQAVDGVSIIIHCASAKKGDAEATRNLVSAASSLQRPPHLVFISVVGADRVSFGYIRSKLEAERVVTESGVPWTILRATQFYDLILSGSAKAAGLPVIPVPAGFRVQPVDPDEVAARLVQVALEEPSGRVPDFGGPHVATAADLVRTYLEAIDRKRLVVQVPIPGTRAIRAGALLVGQPAQEQGIHTWADFLAARLP
jgi:uncharacterized protein YbjT (DUF2867 family)